MRLCLQIHDVDFIPLFDSMYPESCWRDVQVCVCVCVWGGGGGGGSLPP